MVQFCPKCGTKAPDDEALFCNKCGNKLPAIIVEKTDAVCPSCGTKILDEQSGFCNRCGSQLFTSSSVQVQQVNERPAVTRPVIKKKSCPACGALIENENKFYCDSCGTYLRGSGPIKLPQSQRASIPDRRSTQNTAGEIKSSGIAAIASFIIPGLGQIYCGQLGRGIMILIGFFIACLMVLILIGIILAPLVWVWNIYDAYTLANNINSE